MIFSLLTASLLMTGCVPQVNGTPNGHSSTTASAPAGVLVKDLTGLPKLSDKPFVRGLAKLDYGEIERPFGGNTKNNSRLGMGGADGTDYIRKFLIPGTYNAVSMVFQEDARKKKMLDRSGVLNTISNPYANQNTAFDLSKLDEVTRNSKQSIYTYTLHTHFKIPDEYVKNGKFVFESQYGPIQYSYQNYSALIPMATVTSQQCYQMINNEFLSDKKGTYSVKQGNIVDYTLTCYFAGQVEPTTTSQFTIKSIKEFNNVLPKSWKVSAVPDTLAKDEGKSYVLSNRDMFLYEKEVYPAK
jgi:hypothetical protein